MNLWLFLPLGYLFTILIETPVLLVGLSRRHSLGRRLFAGAWLSMCTYPIVVIVLPTLMQPELSDAHRWSYLLVAETFAPVAECLLFWAAFDTEPTVTRSELIQDMIVIVLANLASFLAGEWIYAQPWFGPIRDYLFPVSQGVLTHAAC
jgi:hypothetical protein